MTFTDPEVARVGVTESDAPARARVAELPMTDVDRGLAAAATDGFVKLIAARRRLLGDLGVDTRWAPPSSVPVPAS